MAIIDEAVLSMGAWCTGLAVKTFYHTQVIVYNKQTKIILGVINFFSFLGRASGKISVGSLWRLV